jgi:outer membrane lipoprotein-sorting protein
MFFMRVFLLLIFVVCSSFQTQDEQACKAIIADMITTISGLQTLSYDLDLSERIENKMTHAKSKVKLNVHPRRMYILIPGIGAEVLWREGENDGDALVNPNAFPYINLNLDPMGSLLRSGQHHTLHELGFSYFIKIIGGYVNKAGANFEKFFYCQGEILWDNRNCYKVYIENPDFKYFPYLTKAGESLVTIARKFNVSEYMLMEKNKLDDFGKVKPGSIIQIPNSYAQKTILYIDKVTHMPIYQKIYDDKGLFESYEYHNLKVNPKLSEEDFSRNNKSYNF